LAQDAGSDDALDDARGVADAGAGGVPGSLGAAASRGAADAGAGGLAGSLGAAASRGAADAGAGGLAGSLGAAASRGAADAAGASPVSTLAKATAIGAAAILRCFRRARTKARATSAARAELPGKPMLTIPSSLLALAEKHHRSGLS